MSEAPGCTRGFMGVLWILEDFWHTWENEPLACTRGFMGVLLILEDLWYTWENETPGVPGGYRVLWFLK